MISKQEWFERKIVIHDIDEHIRQNVSAPTTSALWERWREVRLMCIDLAIDELPLKQRRVIKDFFYTKLTPREIAKKLHTKAKNISDLKARATQNLKKNILIRFFLQTAGEENKLI